MKRTAGCITAIILALMLLFSCNAERKEEPEPPVSITMYLWDKGMTKELTPWLEEQFPDIEFTFVVGYNTMTYYTDLFERGNVIPDIITCRRFSLNDAAHLSESLLDLSQSDIVGTFYPGYIENNRETDGSIRWLPMCAEVDGYIANLDLFGKYGVKIPTDYNEFIEAINIFEANGIKGFMTDWRADYTCLEQLQGCSVPSLMSVDGTLWRMNYESGGTGLDETVWPGVFETFESYLDDIRAEQGDSSLGWAEVSPAFLRGEAAMMRGTANDCRVISIRDGINTAMLPYFGKTSDDNWLLTYPICQLAVSRSVEEDSAKKEAVMEVLSAIFSEEGQRKLASGASVLSYNKTVNIEPSDSLKYVKQCIDRNHLYMRLASTEFFSVSKDVVTKMIEGEYGWKEAYDDFDSQLRAIHDPSEEEVIIDQEKAYPLTFTEHGSPSASALLNTMRTGLGQDIAIGYSSVASSPIFEGPYTAQQLMWLMTFKTIAYKCEYTGEEILRIMEWLVNVKEDGSNPVRHYSNLPVTSGMEYSVRDTGNGTFALDGVTIKGQTVEKDRIYTVLLVGEDAYIESDLYCGCPMPEDLKAKRHEQKVSEYNSYECMLEAVRACQQLLPPTEYISFTE
ncbi:MAG: extracellular solute-binding protein [Bullifex sp.]